MTGDEMGRYRDRLLTESIATALRFDRLAEALPGDIYPPYLLVATGIFVEYGVFHVYAHLFTDNWSAVTEPQALAVPAMVVISVVGARYIHDGYAEAMTALSFDDRSDDVDGSVFEGFVPMWLRVGVYLVALVAVYAFDVFVIGIESILADDSLRRFLLWHLLTLPLVYLPALVEFGLAYFSVHVTVPRRIHRSGVGLFFYDPRNMGGFGSIGELLKRSYYLYTAVLLLYFVQTHASVLLPQYLSSSFPSPGPIVQTVLTVGWVVGIATIAYSMFRVHALMKAEKQERIRELETQLKEAMEDPYDILAARITDQEKYDQTRERLAHVRATKTYPTTFTMWSQIFISVLLPQALNLAVRVG